MDFEIYPSLLGVAVWIPMAILMWSTAFREGFGTVTTIISIIVLLPVAVFILNFQAQR